MRKSKQQAEAALQEALNVHLPQEMEATNEVTISAVDKKSLMPKTGNALPIDKPLVGCTQALFFEWRHQTTSSTMAPYCLKANDHEYQGRIYRSMYLIYMTCDSEYEAAIKLLGNFKHWRKLTKCSWFREHLDDWNAELVTREEALAKSKLVTLTQAGNVTAARTLLGNSKKTAGKPKSKGKRTDDIHDSDLDAMLERTEHRPH